MMAYFPAEQVRTVGVSYVFVREGQKGQML
jgi:hypothetical protein